jgi:hypothetical protein
MKPEQPPTPQSSEGKDAPTFPKITLPDDEDIIKALQDKLAEYRERLEKQRAEGPYREPSRFSNDMEYRIAILEKLLTDEKVDAQKLSEEIREKYGDYLDTRTFENSSAVVKNYAETSGKDLKGGTGLKFEKKQKE